MNNWPDPSSVAWRRTAVEKLRVADAHIKKLRYQLVFTCDCKRCSKISKETDMILETLLPPEVSP